MTDLVPTNEIEAIVGIARHPSYHFGRNSTGDEKIYILHSQECLDREADLRDCPFSVALDAGVEESDWTGDRANRPLRLELWHGMLIPAELAP